MISGVCAQVWAPAGEACNPKVGLASLELHGAGADLEERTPREKTLDRRTGYAAGSRPQR